MFPPFLLTKKKYIYVFMHKNVQKENVKLFNDYIYHIFMLSNIQEKM